MWGMASKKSGNAKGREAPTNDITQRIIMKVLEFKNSMVDEEWTASCYKGRIAESVMKSHKMEIQAGYTSSLAYRWKPEDSPVKPTLKGAL